MARKVAARPHTSERVIKWVAMTNRKLSPEELENAYKLLDDIRTRLKELSIGDDILLFAYRRKIFKQLSYDERSSPAARKRLKIFKHKQQGGICPICKKELPKTYVDLDRINAADGYTKENTRLVHFDCHIQDQKRKEYS